MGFSTRQIYLPGAGGSPEFWRPVAALLDDGVPQRMLAWPGLGNEPPAPNVGGVGDLTMLVEEELCEPVDLIAQSMGGLIAVLAALRHRDKVRRLVLTAASVGLHSRALGGSDWLPDYRLNYPNAALWVADPVKDISDELRTITAPVLLIWGDLTRSARWRSGSISKSCFQTPVFTLFEAATTMLRKRMRARLPI